MISGIFRFPRRILNLARWAKAKADRGIYSCTAHCEHLELDLIRERAEGESPWNPAALFRRLSLPHLSATFVVWMNVLSAKAMFESHLTAAIIFFKLSPLIYLCTFFGVMYISPRLRAHRLGAWALGGVKAAGLMTAMLTLFIAGLYIAVIATVLSILWIFAAICLAFVPGLGWAAAITEFQWLLGFFRSRKPSSS